MELPGALTPSLWSLPGCPLCPGARPSAGHVPGVGEFHNDVAVAFKAARAPLLF